MKTYLLFFSLFLLISLNTFSQSWGSLKRKLENEVVDKLVDEVFEDTDADNEDSQSTGTSDRPSQKSGSSGLDNSTDNIPADLESASNQFKASEYREARSSLRRALKSLEFKIGQKLIASLPEDIKGLSYTSDADRVSSSTATWAGLTVHREYQKKDVWAAISVHNSSMSGIAKSAVYSGYYSSSSASDEQYKDISINGYDAVITFSESSGYSIGLPLGQQTFILIEGVNISSEGEMISLAESFDYDEIKDILGEQ